MIDRAEAWERLGLAENEIALLTVGGIRVYRGLQTGADLRPSRRRPTFHIDAAISSDRIP